MQKNPHNLSYPRHSHRWHLGGKFLAQGCGHDHPGHTPMRAGQPMIFTNYNNRAEDNEKIVALPDKVFARVLSIAALDKKVWVRQRWTRRR